MENLDPNLIQQFLEQYQNNNSGDTTLTPTINVFPQEFIALLTTFMIATAILSVLFLIVYIFSTIRKWKVQSAVLDMHRDVKELKAALAGSKTVRSDPKIDNDTSKIA